MIESETKYVQNATGDVYILVEDCNGVWYLNNREKRDMKVLPREDMIELIRENYTKVD